MSKIGSLGGLDLLSTAVLLINQNNQLVYVNSAAENLLAQSATFLQGRNLLHIFTSSATLQSALLNARQNTWSYTGQNIELSRPNETVQLDCTVTPVDLTEADLLLELRPIDQQIQAAREERLIEQRQAHRELIRNLAHEIKNPLGGIRGAAQLLERELDAPDLCEYTQVIVREVDRLQNLMQRLLTPHRPVHPASLNIHEVLEQVRSLLLVEFPDHLIIRRDYDTSLPEIIADRERLVQAVLNIARNAAQALAGQGEIILHTRAVRQVTLAKKRYRLALEIQVVDNGPGIPDEIRERMFYPLVSGRPGGTGLGLSIALDVIEQHRGGILCESRPGQTRFLIRLPLGSRPENSKSIQH